LEHAAKPWQRDGVLNIDERVQLEPVQPESADTLQKHLFNCL